MPFVSKSFRIKMHPIVALGVVAFGTACAGGGVIPDVPAEPAPEPPAEASITIQPRMTEMGARVAIDATGFTPNSMVEIGIGPPESEYQVIRSARTDAQGRVNMTVSVPDWAERGRPYVMVVADQDNQPRVVSNPLIIQQDAVLLRVSGQLTSEGVECRALRSDDGTLYTLAGTGLDAYANGQRVTVTGTIPDASICMQGITISVREITRG